MLKRNKPDDQLGDGMRYGDKAAIEEDVEGRT